MNCPHCGKAIETKRGSGKAEAKYREDVRRAERAIEVLARQPYPELNEACKLEMVRLAAAIEQPAKLYAIYRRNDKKTPVAYGMTVAEVAA